MTIMEERHRKKSKITQLVIPIVTNIARKISRNEKSEKIATEEAADEPEYLHLDYPLDFVSQMKEVFREFDKVMSGKIEKRNIAKLNIQDKSGYICVRELGSLMRALGNNDHNNNRCLNIKWRKHKIAHLCRGSSSTGLIFG